MGVLGSLFGGLAANAVSGTANGIQRRTDNLAKRWRNRGLTPSRVALQTGILAPGDAPPGVSTGSILDYRDVLLPKSVQDLQSGDFPLGTCAHPRANHTSEEPGFPIYLSWGHISKHVAVIGPAGSGKTYGILAPWIVSAAMARVLTVAVDVKGDMMNELRDAKARFGFTDKRRFETWDIGDPAHSLSWNPLAEIGIDPTRTSSDIAQLAQAFMGDPQPNDPNQQFHQRDIAWLRGILTVVHEWSKIHGSVHPKVLYQLVVDQIMLKKVRADVPLPVTGIDDLCALSGSEFSKATSFLKNSLDWLNQPNLTHMLSGTGPKPFTLSGFFSRTPEGRATVPVDVLMVGARISEGEPAKQAAAMMLNLLKLRCMSHFTQQLPIMWILDEAGRYADRIELAQMVSVLRGANCPIIVGLQDVSSLPGDEDKKDQILSNCDAFITLYGVSNKTAEYFSKRLGTTSKMTATHNRGEQDIQVAHQIMPLLGPGEIQNVPLGLHCGVVQLKSASTNPFLFQL